MKATGSDLILARYKNIGNTNIQVFYDPDRNIYAVFVNDTFTSEHSNIVDALSKLETTAHDLLSRGSAVGKN